MRGDRVLFPCSIPNMTSFPVANQHEGKPTPDVVRMIDMMKNENDELRSRLERMEEQMEAAYQTREGVETKA